MEDVGVWAGSDIRHSPLGQESLKVRGMIDGGRNREGREWSYRVRMLLKREQKSRRGGREKVRISMVVRVSRQGRRASEEVPSRVTDVGELGQPKRGADISDVKQQHRRVVGAVLLALPRLPCLVLASPRARRGTCRAQGQLTSTERQRRQWSLGRAQRQG